MSPAMAGRFSTTEPPGKPGGQKREGLKLRPGELHPHTYIHTHTLIPIPKVREPETSEGRLS